MPHTPSPETVESLHPMRAPWSVTRNVSLRRRVTLLSAVLVGLISVIISSAAYFTVSQSLKSDVDAQLRSQYQLLEHASPNSGFTYDQLFSFFNAASWGKVRGTIYKHGQLVAQTNLVPVGEDEGEVIAGRAKESLRTIGGYRVLAEYQKSDGLAVLLAVDMRSTDELLSRLQWVMITIGACGVVLAAVASAVIVQTGLRPVTRLTRAAERVARTDSLAPIPVSGNDELSRLTEAFNSMLAALADSRDRQSRLVADAGHELRTPLTSLRTNVELLMAMESPGAPGVSPADLVELRTDVIAQLEELSTLVGDLVDLARAEAPETVFEEVDVSEVVEQALERVKRRRSDVTFEVTGVQPWFVFGERASMNRAFLNVLDNAAKWSPPNSPVIVEVAKVDDDRAEFTVADSGPGIPPEDRKLVFERFYRSAASRSMPGSGLGLAIVAQVAARIGGWVRAEESAAGGALIRLSMPGSAIPGNREPEVIRGARRFGRSRQ